jgi:hypothetical protein
MSEGIHKCPGCNKEVEQYFVVPSNSLEPFTSVDALKGLTAWGGYGVEREILCQVGAYTHFRFIVAGTEHLVKIEKFDQEAIAAAHEHYSSHPQTCEHIEDEIRCVNAGIPCYFTWSNDVPDGWYCADHAYTNGFCAGCGLFNAGFESFDFSEDGMCESCHEQIESELDDYEPDFEDDGYDYETDY